jgi:uncharacterized lipoprotein YajG
MKTRNSLTTLAAVLLLVGASGCEKPEEATAPVPTKPAAESAHSSVQSATDGAEVAAATKDAAAATSSKAQELITSAQRFFSSGKFQEALAKLKEVGGEKLTPDQQILVNNLTAQIEKVLSTTAKTATDAATSAGGLPKK